MRAKNSSSESEGCLQDIPKRWNDPQKANESRGESRGMSFAGAECGNVWYGMDEVNNAPKGHKEIAQGNALGKERPNWEEP